MGLFSWLRKQEAVALLPFENLPEEAELTEEEKQAIRCGRRKRRKINLCPGCKGPYGLRAKIIGPTTLEFSAKIGRYGGIFELDAPAVATILFHCVDCDHEFTKDCYLEQDSSATFYEK